MVNGLKEKPKQTVRVVAAIGAILLAALIFVLSSIPGGDYPTHPSFLNVVAHFCLYLVLAVLLATAFNSPKRALWKTALAALVITALYGVSDEFHQYFTPGRSSDPFGTGNPFDLIIDSLGALVGSVATIWFLSARKVAKSRKRDKEISDR